MICSHPGIHTRPKFKSSLYLVKESILTDQKWNTRTDSKILNKNPYRSGSVSKLKAGHASSVSVTIPENKP